MAATHTVDPSQAQGAQIPLQKFEVPRFPPQAGSLQALTLTSDIKLDEYNTELQSFSPIPPLPPGIQQLTLELFSLGYPAGFLTALASRLPNVKSLVVYSQILAGTTDETQKDAVSFFEKLEGLRAIHLLDVFARPHFYEQVGEAMRTRERGLLFVEINYTFRHSDEAFLTRVPATELPLLISPGLVTCALNIAVPDTTDDPEDPSNLNESGEEVKEKKEGIMAFNKTLASGLIKALTEEDTKPRALKALNVTLYTMSIVQLKQVLDQHKGLMVLNVTIELEPTEKCKKQLLGTLLSCPELQQVEIVANPSLQFFMAVSNPKQQALEMAFPSADDMKLLSEKCSKLISFKATILRTTSMGTVEWTNEGGSWSGGITRP